jgi:hypothetical protein
MEASPLHEWAGVSGAWALLDREHRRIGRIPAPSGAGEQLGRMQVGSQFPYLPLFTRIIASQ